MERGQLAGEGGAESTERYPDGTRGYSVPPSGADIVADAAADEIARPDSGRRPEGDAVDAVAPVPVPVPFWKREGFASFQDYMAYLRRQQRLYDPAPLRGTLPPEAKLPPDAGPLAADPMLRSHQVNVKLRASEHAELVRVAELYGLAPATLARVMVNRAVKAALAQEP